MFPKQGLCHRRIFVSDLAVVIPTPTCCDGRSTASEFLGGPICFAALRVSPELLLGFYVAFTAFGGYDCSMNFKTRMEVLFLKTD